MVTQATIVIGVLGTNILGTAIGAQVNGTGISGTIRGNTPMYMDQELVGLGNVYSWQVLK